MTQFNLKKKKSREIFFFDKNNIISEIGNELIFLTKLVLLKKDLDQVLVIDNYEIKDHPKILNYQYSEFEEIGKKKLL